MSQQTKKIGYLTTIIFVVASTIGAGIFMKNGELFGYAQGNFGLVIASWIVAGIGIMALGLAVSELVSAQTTNRAVFEWTSKFVGPMFHKIAVNYNKYVYIPMALFTMPVYLTMNIQAAGFELNSGLSVLAVSYIIVTWFLLFNLLPIKASGVMQWFTTIVKFAPLFIVPFYGFMNSGDIEGGIYSVTPGGINGIAPAMILIAGIPAITFAYDGFQTTTALKEEMEEPQKLGSAMVIGIGIITLIYAFVTLGLGLGSGDGTINQVGTMSYGSNTYKVMSALVGIGILGIVNGTTAALPRVLASKALFDGEANEVRFINKLLFKKTIAESTDRERFLAGWTYALVSATLFFIVFGSIGVWGYTLNSYPWYETSVATLYTFADTLVNFMSLLFILIIVTTVAGGIKNRTTNKVKVEKYKYFIPVAWFSVILFYASGAWVFIAAIIDSTGFNNADSKSSLIRLGVLLVIIAVSVIPALIPSKSNQVGLQNDKVK